MTKWRVITGDARERLASLPDASVQACVTSPPYFGLRDYGHDGQIGLEDTPDAYVEQLVAVFREVRRVLRDDGTVWLNIGDAYANGGSGPPGERSTLIGNGHQGGGAKRHALTQTRPRPPRLLASAGIKPKDLIGIPWLVAFALRADGWYLRSDIIWSKPNPMPESVTDRPTKAHEYLFLLSKSARYFYDADAVREAPASDAADGRRGDADATQAARLTVQSGGRGATHMGVPDRGRNKRSVWTVSTKPYAGAHFATMPPALAELAIRAGSPPQACAECGAPWVRVVERERPAAQTGRIERLAATQRKRTGGAIGGGSRSTTLGLAASEAPTRTTGWESSCDHHDGNGAAIVLDPFAGAGTTGLVALRQGRGFVGVELNAEYAELARQRIRDDSPLHNGHAEDLDQVASA